MYLANDVRPQTRTILPKALDQYKEFFIPERRLYIAIIITALDDYIRLEKDSNEFKKITQWFIKNDYHLPTSFVTCCRVSSLSAYKIRKRLSYLREEKIRRGNYVKKGHLYDILKRMAY